MLEMGYPVIESSVSGLFSWKNMYKSLAVSVHIEYEMHLLCSD